MSLHLDDLHKRYGATRAVDGVTLALADGETLALLGPSGCGKSTLLRLLAGLERPDAGRIRFGAPGEPPRDITARPPQRRGFGMVFQDYALFPHLSVADNVAFGLVELGWSRAERRRRVAELLELVGLAGLEARRVPQLSGGQQQRVALARALAPRPRVLLLDEPLSNLDQSLRESLKEELRSLLAELEVLAVYVTHDQSEAFTVAERVAVMRRGRLAQVGARDAVAARPRDAWVARFLGHRNVLDAAALPPAPLGPPAERQPAGPVLLRTDLVRLRPAAPAANAAKAAGAVPDGARVDARVIGARRDGLGWQLQLEVPAWRVTLQWEGYARDLPAAPEPGAALRLEIPADAWVPLEPEETAPPEEAR